MEQTYWLTRFCLQRSLAGIYAIAFLIAINQFRGLCGRGGILPMSLYLRGRRFRDLPTLFFLNESDAFILTLAWTGFLISLFALTGYSDAFGLGPSVATWFLLWILYMSFVNTGQEFYGFGWEVLLLETGFLAIFLGPSSSKPSVIPIYLYLWLLFRLMFGAGLIKIRGDPCWRDLTCMKYHYETMPLPGPTSWYFHRLPLWIHKVSVAFNHFVELPIPFFYFAPQPWRAWAGILTVIFQGIIILSGNFSWLNHISLVIALACFDDQWLAKLGPWLVSWAHTMGVTGVADAAGSLGIPSVILVFLTAMIAYLSLNPIKNLFSKGQIMNTSFDPFHLVNTYGAFGSITRTRDEVILAGADDMGGPWKEFEFKAKPGRVDRMPPLVSPYHYKLDWQMWFAAMTPYYYHPWILNFIARLLQGNKEVNKLIRHNPFRTRPPRFIRASLYRYHYTRSGSRNWWDRRFKDEYLPPLSLENPSFMDILKSQGWLAGD